MKEALLALLGAICLSIAGNAQMIPGDRQPFPGEEARVLTELKRSPTGTPRIEALLDAGFYYLFLPGEEKEDLSRAFDYARQAREQSRAQGYEEGYTDGLLLAGLAFNESGKKDVAKIALDSAQLSAMQNRDQAHRSGQTRREARAQRQLAMISGSLWHWSEAEKDWLQLLQLYKTMGYPYLHYTYEHLALVLMLVNDFDKSLFYILEAIKSMERTGDDSEAALFYYDLGYIYRQLGQVQKGMDYLQEAFRLYQRTSSPVMFEMLPILAETYTKLGRAAGGLDFIDKIAKAYPPRSRYQQRVIEDAYATCYRALGKFDLANVHLKKATALIGEAHPLYLYEIMATGQLYFEWGKFDSARLYLETCLRSGIFWESDLSRLHFLLYRVDSAQGHYLSAIGHLLNNKKLDDSLHEEAKARATKELEVRYETAKKDNELKQVRLYRNLTIAGIGILSMILALLYRQYKMKVKSNREIREKAGSLERLVDEKEWLLKEVHHRVKNNLHIVTSLLESQSALAGGDARRAIQDSQHRLYAMSLIHQKLYQGAGGATIDFGMYLRELVLYLRESFDVGAHLHFSIEADEIGIDAAQAAHLGLILNEAITNAIKYAFVGRSHGNIDISVRRKPDDYLLLVVKDDGIGLPANFDMEQSKSLGMRLMKGLSEDYEGNLRISTGEGTTVTLVCRIDRVLRHLDN